MSTPAGGTVLSFPGARPNQVGFARDELMRILDLYGRMVAAGEWRDYAMDFGRDAASFAAFRRAARVAPPAPMPRPQCASWRSSFPRLRESLSVRCPDIVSPLLRGDDKG